MRDDTNQKETDRTRYSYLARLSDYEAVIPTAPTSEDAAGTAAAIGVASSVGGQKDAGL